MLLHNQKSMYHMDDVEKTNLTDMVLVAINEVTKFNPENTDGSSYDFGVDFTNISPFNPYMISDVLQDLGYEDVDLDTNGWDHDYWSSFTHPDDKLKESIDNRVTALQQKQQAQVEQETAKVQAQTALIKAQNDADIKVTKAEAEAKANKLKSESLTPELIQMTEAEARLKHGWVTVQGADATVVDASEK